MAEMDFKPTDEAADVVAKLVASMTQEQIQSLLDHFAASAREAEQAKKLERPEGENASPDHE